MIDSIPKLATVGQIADLLDAPVYRIEYILRSRRHIRPRAIAAGARCFDDHGVSLIRHELNAIDARRAEREDAETGGAA